MLLSAVSAGASAWHSLANVLSPWAGVNDQHPLALSAGTRNYSFGFHLAASYGAAAVVIEGPRPGERQDLTWLAYGDADYRNTMAMLSLEASQHPA